MGNSIDEVIIPDNKDTLSTQEQENVIRNTFGTSALPTKYVADPQKYIEDTISRIDGFDVRWSSLITSNPILFESIEYLRVKAYVNETITQEEIEAYKRGDLRECYATFDNMLVCNLKYFNRIINFCTMIFAHYIRLDDDEVITEGMEKLPYEVDMTPTKIWCCALSSPSSTVWELQYAWGNPNNCVAIKPIKSSTKSVLEVSWHRLYRNPVFARFTELCALRCGTYGFRTTLLADITPNNTLSRVCKKFTSASVALSEEQLETIWDYIVESNAVQQSLYNALERCMMKLFNNDTSMFGVYVFANDVFIHTAKFSLRIRKDEKGKLSKEYLSNSYECFAAEPILAESVREQIAWAKYELPVKFQYDKTTLTSLLTNMLNNDYHSITCLKRMNEYGVVSRIRFMGTFNNVIIKEELMKDNNVIKSYQKVLSKPNAARYIIERGYYIFGLNDDVYKFMSVENINRSNITEHYCNYAVPVLKYMFDIITQHVKSKNDIIDIMIAGDIPEYRLNNRNIKYTSLVKIEARQMMNNIMLRHQSSAGKKSYWKVIED